MKLLACVLTVIGAGFTGAVLSWAAVSISEARAWSAERTWSVLMFGARWALFLTAVIALYLRAR
jgi:hypothetical protein